MEKVLCWSLESDHPVSRECKGHEDRAHVHDVDGLKNHCSRVVIGIRHPYHKIDEFSKQWIKSSRKRVALSASPQLPVDCLSTLAFVPTCGAGGGLRTFVDDARGMGVNDEMQTLIITGTVCRTIDLGCHDNRTITS